MKGHIEQVKKVHSPHGHNLTLPLKLSCFLVLRDIKIDWTL